MLHGDDESPALPSARRIHAVLAAGLCATFSAGGAHAVPLIIDIPDVALTGTAAVDFNGDGIAEFVFRHVDGPLGMGNTVDALGGNAVVQSTKGGSYAAALSGGQQIDATRTFVEGTDIVLSAAIKGYAYGDFSDPGLAYLGVRFDIPNDTATHFGWVELLNQGGAVTLTRLFWDDVPGAPVSTPAAAVSEPGTLALLIAGAAGVLALRRRERR